LDNENRVGKANDGFTLNLQGVSGNDQPINSFAGQAQRQAAGSKDSSFENFGLNIGVSYDLTSKESKLVLIHEIENIKSSVSSNGAVNNNSPKRFAGADKPEGLPEIVIGTTAPNPNDGKITGLQS